MRLICPVGFASPISIATIYSTWTKAKAKPFIICSPSLKVVLKSKMKTYSHRFMTKRKGYLIAFRGDSPSSVVLHVCGVSPPARLFYLEAMQPTWVALHCTLALSSLLIHTFLQTNTLCGGVFWIFRRRVFVTDALIHSFLINCYCLMERLATLVDDVEAKQSG